MPLVESAYELIVYFDINLSLVDEEEAASDLSLLEYVLGIFGLCIYHLLAYLLQFVLGQGREQLVVLQLLNRELELRVMEFISDYLYLLSYGLGEINGVLAVVFDLLIVPPAVYVDGRLLDLRSLRTPHIL